MLILSVKDVKTLLNLESTQYDNYIEAMIPVVIDLVEKHCNDEFSIRNIDGNFINTNEGYIITNIGLKIVISKIIEYYLIKAGISYESIGRINYTYTTDLPPSIINSMKPYHKSRMKFL